MTPGRCSFSTIFATVSRTIIVAPVRFTPITASHCSLVSFDTAPVVLALAVLAWVAGFDTIYACQDVEFDRREGLRSLPARLGVPRALLVARVLHAAAVALLAALYVLVPLHPVYLAGVAAVAALLVYEHSLVSPGDLSRHHVTDSTESKLASFDVAFHLLPVLGSGAFGNYYQCAMIAPRIPLIDHAGDFVVVERNLRNQNDVSATSESAMQGNPAGVAAHRFHHHDAFVARRGSMETIQRVHNDIHG